MILFFLNTKKIIEEKGTKNVHLTYKEMTMRLTAEQHKGWNPYLIAWFSLIIFIIITVFAIYIYETLSDPLKQFSDL